MPVISLAVQVDDTLSDDFFIFFNPERGFRATKRAAPYIEKVLGMGWVGIGLLAEAALLSEEDALKNPRLHALCQVALRLMWGEMSRDEREEICVSE